MTDRSFGEPKGKVAGTKGPIPSQWNWLARREPPPEGGGKEEAEGANLGRGWIVIDRNLYFKIDMKTIETIIRGGKIFAAIIASAAALSACSSDDSDDLAASQIPTDVKTTFKSMYPDAAGVEWSQTALFYVADFTQDTFEYDAWYLPSGSWQMTQIDYDQMISMLPVAVLNAFQNSDYSLWTVDDASLYQRPSDSFSIIEVESNLGQEVALVYDAYGNLLHTLPGDDYQILPTTVLATL